jgi:hypothetical protein
VTVTLLSVRVRESRVTGLPLLQRGRVGERVGVVVALLSVRVRESRVIVCPTLQACDILLTQWIS